jgi:hypothetical protein
MGDYLMTYYPEVHWGDGSDGDVTISVDTNLAGVVKQYNNLTIDAGIKLWDSTGVLRIYVRNKLTLNGDIDQRGLGGEGGEGSAGVMYCTSTPPGGQPGELGLTRGGTGAYGQANSNGSFGQLPYAPPGINDDTLNLTYLSEMLDNFDYFDDTTTALTAGIGGGGSGGGGGNTSLATPQGVGGHGGKGGNGGGFIFVAAKKIVGSGIITAAGTDGADGTLNDTAYGGGGGGGGGGVAICYYKSSDELFTVSGAGGSGGSYGHTTAEDGMDGITIRRKWLGV